MTVYGFAAHLAVEAYDLDAASAKPVGGSTTEEWQATLGEGSLVAANALYAVYPANGDEFPRRIVAHYDVTGERMGYDDVVQRARPRRARPDADLGELARPCAAYGGLLR